MSSITSHDKDTKNREDIFTNIYNTNCWGINSETQRPSSGPGSNPAFVTPYVTFVMNFMRKKEIKSVVDLGCGDWQFSKCMDWTGIRYLGIDCVKSVVDYNIKSFARKDVAFLHADICDNSSVIPKADLYLIKDVLQHLKNADIIKILNYLRDTCSSCYIIVCNCSNQEYHYQENVATGETRPLRSDFDPLRSFGAVHIKNLGNKEISVIANGYTPDNLLSL